MSAALSDSKNRRRDDRARATGIDDQETPRRVLVEASWPSLHLRLCREDISRPSQWSIHSPQTVVVVHLGGQMQSLKTRIEGHGVRDRVARPGEIWLVPAQRHYQGQAMGKQVAYAELELGHDFANDMPAQRHWRTAQLSACLGRRDEFLGVTVRKLGQLLRAGDDLSLLLADSLQAAVRMHLLRSYRSADGIVAARSGAAGAIDAAIAGRLFDYIEANLDQRIVLADLATVAGVSEHRLLAGFRRQFGKTPAQFVLDRRVRRARRLLAQPHHGIADIALATGFSSHSHFSAAFRQRTGQTPQQFRRSR